MAAYSRNKPSQSMRPLLIAVAIFVFAVACAQPVAFGAPEDNDRLTAIADAYLSNRESFQTLACDFVITVGWADDIAAAKAGRLREAVSGQGRWRLSGEKVRLDITCDPAVVERAKQAAGRNGPWSTALASEAFISDGQRQVVFGSDAGAGNVFPPEQQSRGVSGYLPYDIRVRLRTGGEAPSPAFFIKDTLAKRGYVAISDKQTESGEPVVSIKVGESADQLSAAFDLDPKRGYIPISFSDYGNDGKTVVQELLTTDIRQAANGCWFPYRSVCFTPLAFNGRYWTRTCTVERLDLQAPPEREFEIEMRKGSALSNTLDPYSSIFIEKTGRYGPDQIKGLLERTYQAAAEAHARHTAVAQKSGPKARPANEAPLPSNKEGSGRSWSRQLGIIAIALLLALGTFFVIRRIQRRRPNSNRG
jgi:hypothetical protein